MLEKVCGCPEGHVNVIAEDVDPVGAVCSREDCVLPLVQWGWIETVSNVHKKSWMLEAEDMAWQD